MTLIPRCGLESLVLLMTLVPACSPVGPPPGGGGEAVGGPDGEGYDRHNHSYHKQARSDAHVEADKSHRADGGKPEYGDTRVFPGHIEDPSCNPEDQEAQAA